MGLGDPQMDFLDEISMIPCSIWEKVEQNEEQHKKTEKNWNNLLRRDGEHA